MTAPTGRTKAGAETGARDETAVRAGRRDDRAHACQAMAQAQLARTLAVRLFDRLEELPQDLQEDAVAIHRAAMLDKVTLVPMLRQLLRELAEDYPDHEMSDYLARLCAQVRTALEPRPQTPTNLEGAPDGPTNPPLPPQLR